MRFTRRTVFALRRELGTIESHRKVLAIALPIMAANVSEPLIGVVDTAVIGQLPEPHYIGAVSIGALIFSFVYWGFGFLRMGTGGFAAQAFGAGETDELRAVLARAMLIAGAIGVLLIAVSPWIEQLAFTLLEGSQAVEDEAATYFRIRIFSAPFALANYAMLGWFIGMGVTRIAFAIQIFLNISNMVLDALFVLGFGMATAGVGLGTLLAEIGAALVGFVFVHRELKRRGGGWDMSRLTDRARLLRTFSVNGDIMVRTFCLAFAFWWFTAQGARIGDTVLAANAILMHFFSLGSFLIDGFANAAEALAGQAVGARDRDRFAHAVRVTSLWAGVVGLALGALILIGGPLLIDLLTVNPDVQATARAYLWWVAATPILGAACFQLDGIFIGATRTRDLRNMMIVSLALFLASVAVLLPAFGNAGLWSALLVFLAFRGLTLGVRLPALARDAFPAGQPALTR